MSEAGDSGDIEPIYVRIGQRLAAVRRERGLTQEVLSARAGVSANYLARAEGGYHRPNLSKLEGIAEALEVSVASLFTEQVEPPSSRVSPILLAELETLSRDDQHLVLQIVRRLKTPGAAPERTARNAGDEGRRSGAKRRSARRSPTTK